MAVFDEVITAMQMYQHETGEKPCFVCVPIDRARALINHIMFTSPNTHQQVIDLSKEDDDRKFKEGFDNMTLYGARLHCILDQVVLGGWAAHEDVDDGEA